MSRLTGTTPVQAGLQPGKAVICIVTEISEKEHSKGNGFDTRIRIKIDGEKLERYARIQCFEGAEGVEQDPNFSQLDRLVWAKAHGEKVALASYMFAGNMRIKVYPAELINEARQWVASAVEKQKSFYQKKAYQAVSASTGSKSAEALRTPAQMPAHANVADEELPF